MKIKNYILLFILCVGYFSSVKSQDIVVDSLEKILNKNLHDTTSLKTLVELSNVCGEADIQKYAEQALQLAEKLHSNSNPKIKSLARKSMAAANNNLAYAFQTRGEVEKAIIHYNKSLAIRKEIKDNVGIGECLVNLGYLLEQKGNISAALENYHEALTYYEFAKSKSGKAYALNNIGFIYQKQEDLSKALEYYLKSKKLREEIGDKHGLSQSLTNLGAVYKMQKNYEEALKTHFKSLVLQEELDDESGISNSYNNIGYIYENGNDLDKALSYYKQSLEIREKIREKKGMANSLNNIGRIYLMKKNISKSLEAANRSYILSKELGFPENIKNSSKLLAVLYKKQGKYKETVEMLEEYFRMHDSISSEGIRKNTAKQQLRYEFGIKLIADSIKHIEQQKVKDAQITAQQAEIKSDRSKKLAMFGVLFLLVIFGAVMSNRFKVTQKQKAIIEKQKINVELQKEIVEAKQKEILDSINYAKRIQFTLLAHNDLLKGNLTDFFILFQPKDIVSGDFYWATQKENLFFLAVCDSTGHGVPGAFMSLLNISFINEAITEKNILEPNKIFEYVREQLIISVSKDGAQDGMDGILLCFNKAERTITYSSSQNASISVQNNHILKLNADKMPIGKGIVDEPFKLFQLNSQPGDMIYLYTDGFADQFGGINGKKFKYKPLQELLLTIANEPLEIQKRKVKTTFDNWKGELEQIDDVCVIGVRV